MELIKFLQLLKKYSLVLLFVPITMATISYFLVRNLPNQYTSRSRIATGIIDPTDQILSIQDFTQESKVNQQFGNLIQLIQLKRNLYQLGYQLILHDLKDSIPYRKISKNIKNLNPAARKHAIEVFTEKYEKQEPLQMANKDQFGLFEVMASMGYDDEGLMKNMLVFRVFNSDFIQIEFESENAQLSAFAVNELSTQFINYYNVIVKDKQGKALDFLDQLVKRKQDSMEQKMGNLKTYKIDNRVLNLNEQAKSLYAQIADYETRKQSAEKDIESNTGALANIDSKFEPGDRQYLESTLTNINQEILQTKEYLRSASDELIKSNYDVKYKQRLDSLKTVLSSQINRLSDKFLANPLATKQDIVGKKITLEINLELAKYSVQSIGKELTKLNLKFDKLVPHEAVIQSYENAIDIAGKEYIEVLKKLNQTSLESSTAVKLRQIEMGMPGVAKPSKKMLLVALAGIVSFVICMVALFVLFYLDNTVQFAKELANKTNLPVLGSLNKIGRKTIDINNIWNTTVNDNVEVSYYKKMIAAIRFEVEQEMGNKKILGITSIEAMEGKSVVSIGLANAYALMGKKVLLIDGNFYNNSITQYYSPNTLVQDWCISKINTPIIAVKNNLSVLGNSGGNGSINELDTEQVLKEKLLEASTIYDIVILDCSGLHTMNKAKEWLILADKIVAVFESGKDVENERKNLLTYIQHQPQKFAGFIFNKENVSRKKIQNTV